MCGRFALVEPVPEIARLFGVALSALEPEPPGRARFNIAPQTPVLAVRSDGAERHGVWLRWGLVPAWARDGSIGLKMINARSEGVETRPAYKAAFARRRCLVPVSAFYEWGPPLAPKGPRQPYAFRLPGRGAFALGGIWEENTQAGGGAPLRTLSILTTSAAPPVAALHDRMPVIVPTEAYDLWLSPQAAPQAVHDLCVPSPAGRLEAYPVSTAMNRAAFEDASCLEPIEA